MQFLGCRFVASDVGPQEVAASSVFFINRSTPSIPPYSSPLKNRPSNPLLRSLGYDSLPPLIGNLPEVHVPRPHGSLGDP